MVWPLLKRVEIPSDGVSKYFIMLYIKVLFCPLILDKISLLRS